MKRLVQGTEAIFLGALRAGGNFFAGYPISPSTEILILAAEHASRNPDFKFIQSEDELAAANAIIGASLAGAKSFTATSGPGFTLMQEAIGYGHKVEVPTVFVNTQRVGPATAMPTMPAQQDVLQTHYGSSGDYYPLAFCPNSVAECHRYIIITFNAAEESLSPAILLSDGFVGHLNEVVDLDAVEVEIVPRSRPPLGTGKRSFTGLSHDENGNPQTADAVIYKQWLSKVKERHEKVAARYRHFEFQGNASSDTLLISYGIVSRVVAPLASQFAMFRPIRIFPMLGDELREYSRSYEKIVVVEANDGQYACLVERELKRDVVRVPLLGGRINLELARKGLSDKLGKEVS
ncbi:MAG TPA: 2-oxoacid:acceptor oxidoreductase subunit alpha [Dehalococcoidia bacterium]|nr:2-oxoacid:acceptor oxidoreductase subunit alpha [Dehalococcoidia bacterium]